MARTDTTSPPPQPGPAWDLARLWPDQGDLDDADYLSATRHSRRIAELNDGYLEVPPVPTTEHQLIVQFLSNLLLFFVRPRARGQVLFAPLRVRLRRGKYREPDVIFMLTENVHRIGNEYWDGADLVMEVVSPDGPERDRVIKRREYAEAGIREYWIVDPLLRQITVLELKGPEYAVHGEFKDGQKATSVLLPGFEADVTATFEAAKLGQ